MKKSLVLGLTLCGAALLLSSCKSRESAYRQAFEKAKAQGNENSLTNTEVAVVTENTQQNNNVSVTPVTPTVVDHSDVRTIDGGVTVVKGDALNTYSVVVGSFVTQANAESLMNTLKERGYAARVVRTNETISGHTGWFRVIASSYDDKASAVQSRNELNSTYAGAWLLYNKK